MKAADVEAIVIQAEDYLTPEGRKRKAAARAAIVEAKAARADDLDVYLRANESIRRDSAQIDELDRKAAPSAVAPIFQIANFGDSNNGVVLARTLDGHATVQFVNGRPYLLDEHDGSLFPAIEKTDADTGATYYERVSVAGGS